MLIGKNLILIGLIYVILSWATQGVIAYCAGNEGLTEPDRSIPIKLMKREISGRLIPQAILEPLADKKINGIERFRNSNIAPEDVRSYLLEDWENIYEIIKQCSGTNLPRADQTFDLLTSTSPRPLSALLSVLKNKFNLYPKPEEELGVIVPALQLEPEKKEEVRIILGEISKTATDCTETITSLVRDLHQVATGQVATEAEPQIQVPQIEAPLEEKADMLLTQFAELEKNSDMEFPSFFKRHHSEKIRMDSLSLAYFYGRLFEQLPSDPELLFPEQEGVPERERPDRGEQQQSQTSPRSLLEYALRQTGMPQNLLMR